MNLKILLLPIVMVDVKEDHSTTWLILFSIPRLVIAGDVVEFSQ